MDKIFYRDGNVAFGETDGKYYLTVGEKSYWLSDYPFVPDLYIKGPEGLMTMIHNSFTVAQLRSVATEGGTMTMVTGDTYDTKGIIRLLLKAIEIGMDSVDIGYLEARIFVDYMEEKGAVSPETAVDPEDVGIFNPNVMNSFLHSKKVDRTDKALFYLRDPNKESEAGTGEGTRFRVISNQVRFGCGYRFFEGGRQYYAWHGYPNRNDDFITIAEISEGEYEEINREYPVEIVADRETAEVFRNKYVDGHPVIKEGWNVWL